MRGLRVLGLAATAALVLSACGGSSGSGSPSSAAGGGGVITIGKFKASQPLFGQANNEVAGWRYISSIFSGLVYLDASGKPHMDAAESLVSTDNKHWVIKIKPNQKFTNGEPLTAKSFVDAWNFGAKASNAMANRDFYSDIQGFTQQGNNDLSGLKVVNDLEFTVDLRQPSRSFLLQLATGPFYPLPESAYKDIQTFGQHPVGNGPYKIESFSPGVEMKLVRNPDYTGPRQPENNGIIFKVYTKPEAAYADIQGGTLDVLDQMPSSSLKEFKSDMGDRWVSKPVAQTWYLLIPASTPHFGFNKEGILRREAISHAINREAIAKEVFFGTRTPAKDFTSPVMAGYDPDISGNDVLKTDDKEAKELWAEANAISPYTGTFTINYSIAAGDGASYDAMAHQINNVLGITALAAPQPNFGATRDAGVSKREPFRVAYSADWPAQGNLLSVFFKTGASANYEKFSNPRFDQLLSQADAATGAQASAKLYEEAQEILFDNMPTIPLFYQNGTMVWSKRMENPAGAMDWSGLVVPWMLKAKS